MFAGEESMSYDLCKLKYPVNKHKSQGLITIQHRDSYTNRMVIPNSVQGRDFCDVRLAFLITVDFVIIKQFFPFALE